MNVLFLIVLYSTTTFVIGDNASAGRKTVSNNLSVKKSYGPSPINAPSPDAASVTIPRTSKVPGTAYSAAIAQSAAAGSIHFPEEAAVVQTPLMPYSFEYGVNDEASGLDFGHQESSDGAVVTGTYYVLLPDRRMQTVNYKADGNGYVAKVSYEGEAKYDAVQTQKASGIPSGISGQLQAFSNSGGLSASIPSSRPVQTPSFLNSGPKAATHVYPAQPAYPTKERVPEVSAPVWPAVKAPMVPIAPVVGPTPSVVPATSAAVNAAASVSLDGRELTSAPIFSMIASPLSQAPAGQRPAIPVGFARSPVQPAVQTISYGQAFTAVPAPLTNPAYPVAPVSWMPSNPPKPLSNSYSI